MKTMTFQKAVLAALLAPSLLLVNAPAHATNFMVTVDPNTGNTSIGVWAGAANASQPSGSSAAQSSGSNTAYVYPSQMIMSQGGNGEPSQMSNQTLADLLQSNPSAAITSMIDALNKATDESRAASGHTGAMTPEQQSAYAENTRNVLRALLLEHGFSEAEADAKVNEAMASKGMASGQPALPNNVSASDEEKKKLAAARQQALELQKKQQELQRQQLLSAGSENPPAAASGSSDAGEPNGGADDANGQGWTRAQVSELLSKFYGFSGEGDDAASFSFYLAAAMGSGFNPAGDISAEEFGRLVASHLSGLGSGSQFQSAERNILDNSVSDLINRLRDEQSGQPGEPQPLTHSGYMLEVINSSDVTSLAMSTQTSSSSVSVAVGEGDTATLTKSNNTLSSEAFGYRLTFAETATCEGDCSEVYWGEWASLSNTNSGYWVVGKPATTAEMDRQVGSANYIGEAKGTAYGEAASGRIIMAVDFDNRSGGYEVNDFMRANPGEEDRMNFGGSFDISGNKIVGDKISGTFTTNAGAVFGHFRDEGTAIKGVFAAGRRPE